MYVGSQTHNQLNQPQCSQDVPFYFRLTGRANQYLLSCNYAARFIAQNLQDKSDHFIHALLCIEHLHIHSNENSHENNHGYNVKLAILLYKLQCVSCDKKCKTLI